jgi:hypothetical protein
MLLRRLELAAEKVKFAPGIGIRIEWSGRFGSLGNAVFLDRILP